MLYSAVNESRSTITFHVSIKNLDSDKAFIYPERTHELNIGLWFAQIDQNILYNKNYKMYINIMQSHFQHVLHVPQIYVIDIKAIIIVFECRCSKHDIHIISYKSQDISILLVTKLSTKQTLASKQWKRRVQSNLLLWYIAMRNKL